MNTSAVEGGKTEEEIMSIGIPRMQEEDLLAVAGAKRRPAGLQGQKRHYDGSAPFIENISQQSHE